VPPWTLGPLEDGDDQDPVREGPHGSAEQLAFASRLCERDKVELRLGDLADLSFLRGDSVDLVFSSYSFGYVEDLQRSSARPTACSSGDRCSSSACRTPPTT